MSESADLRAEDAVLDAIEKRRALDAARQEGSGRLESRRDLFNPPPYGATAPQQDPYDAILGESSSAVEGRNNSPPPRQRSRKKYPSSLANAATRVVQMSRLKRMNEAGAGGATVELMKEGGRGESARNLISSAQSTESPFLGAGSGHRRYLSCADRLFEDLQRVETLFRGSQRVLVVQEDGDPSAQTEANYVAENDVSSPHTQTTRPNASQRGELIDSSPYVPPPPLPNGTDVETGEQGEASELLPKSSSKGPMLRLRSQHCRSPFLEALSLRVLCKHAMHFLRMRFLFIVIPLLGAAHILFNYCNFELEFLPSDASLSWWLIFAVRQLLTFHLALCTEYLVVDAFALRSTMAPKVLGPLLTLYTIQANGWPFVISVWGGWDLVLLHGENAFARNWLFFLNVPLLSGANPDGGVISSVVYLRVLLSMVVIGVSVGIKRTYLALYLGRRTFAHYKPRLEQILETMLLLSEVADLAGVVESPEFAKTIAADVNVRAKSMMPSTIRGSKKWEGIQFTESSSESSDSDDESLNIGVGNMTGALSFESNDVDTDVRGAGIPQEHRTTSNVSDSPSKQHRKRLDDSSAENFNEATFRAHYLQESDSVTTIKIKDLLDRWEEPENKRNSGAPASIHDILQFRKAISLMDESHPFSVSFGPSDTRDRCIKSAQKVYKRLLKLSPESEVLPFGVIEALAYDESGNVQDAKKLSLVRLFRPDRHDEVSMLAFVQSCDWVYKKLRFFRASVANSSLIDQVLEQIFNFFFYVILSLVTISGILDLDPWSLLVSVSTLLVSFSFAVGSSVSKCIEGILLIAVRKPFDLGDRISLSLADAMTNPDGALAWFVEDVNLFTTTLRFAATNEVATINNGAIANSRIVNFARSSKALITLDLLFSIHASHEKIDTFKKAVATFVKDNPRTWSSIVHFRTTQIDPDSLLVGYSLRLQHMKSWQESAQVLSSRGELLKFCVTAMEQLGIVYNSPAKSMNVSMKNLPGMPEGIVKARSVGLTNAADALSSSIGGGKPPKHS